jgi:hypothetical protein
VKEETKGVKEEVSDRITVETEATQLKYPQAKLRQPKVFVYMIGRSEGLSQRHYDCIGVLVAVVAEFENTLVGSWAYVAV